MTFSLNWSLAGLDMLPKALHCWGACYLYISCLFIFSMHLLLMRWTMWWQKWFIIQTNSIRLHNMPFPPSSTQEIRSRKTLCNICPIKEHWMIKIKTERKDSAVTWVVIKCECVFNEVFTFFSSYPQDTAENELNWSFNQEIQLCVKWGRTLNHINSSVNCFIFLFFFLF